eukprot:COSAG02_NODE_27650_length_605_cov_0.841897_1_plen_115_part_00
MEETGVAPYANRTLDPIVFAHSTASHNLSLAHAVGPFKQLWREISVVQNSTFQASSTATPTELNASYAFREWRSLDHESLGIDFLGGKSCADMNRCVGVRATDGTTCVCYASAG